ncbi:type VI secretion system Vgr family protein [Ideonella sp.]|jgi:type VI secretion system secreted protein VgrG|uniref:type VI secretion system Vgr family protein n=1 Tax=Ideonella sp. TaxID=1929293 RepID=UPI0037BEA840
MSIATLFPASTAALVSQVVAALSGDLSGAPTQAQRLLRLHTPLGPDVLLAERATLKEALLHEAPTAQAGDAGLRIELDALCTNTHLQLKSLMGQPAVLELLQADGSLRPWHAHITQVALLGSDGGLARYRLTLEPWLAFLGQRQDAWVFQNQTVMQIIDEVFSDYQSQGQLAPAWRWELADASVYPERSLCTQYQETDLAFVQRLLAEEGLFAWWEHSASLGGAALGQHTLVIADHNPAFKPNAQPLARFTQSSAVLPEDSVHGLARMAQVHTSSVHLASEDYRTLGDRPVSQTGHAGQGQTGQGPALLPALLQADVPGAYNYVDAAHGERLALRQVQALDALRSRLSLHSSLRQAAPGTHWLLTEHALHSGLNPVDDQFVTLATTHVARNNLRADIKAGLANLLGPVTFEAVLGAGADLLGAGASSISLVDRDEDEGDEADTHTLPNQSPEPIHHCTLVVQPLAVPVAPYAWATLPDTGGTLHTPEVRLRPRPRITGVQTALVVGLGDPVHTDRDHRVKVQFHWQRGSQGSHRLDHPAGSNAPASDAAWSWVRVAERQSGANWGSVFTPRVGQEVLVGFTGGDIDRPVVLGSLYNGQGQPDAQGNAVSAGAAGAVGSANAWFPGQAKQGELQAHAHPQVHSGFKSQELSHSQTGQGGCNQLVLDDSPGSNRIQLSSSSAATKLQLGHLLQQTDNQRLQARGHGLDLATSAWGAVRAGQGMVLSAGYAPGGSQAAHMQLISRPLADRLEQSHALVHTLAESAQAHHAKLATEPEVKGATPEQADKQLPAERGLHASMAAWRGQDSQAEVIDVEMHEATDAPSIGGGLGSIDILNRPDLLVAGQGGIASVTPAHHLISAGATSSWVAGQDLQHLAQGHHSSAAKDGIVLYTHGKATNTAKPNTETGMALHAASGSVQTQTQSGATHLTADANVNVTSTSAQVSVGSPQKVLLAAGGAALTIQGGKISLTGPGSIELKAGMKNFTGPGSAGPSSLRLNGGAFESKQHFMTFRATNAAGEPLANRKYAIFMPDGSIQEGTTDEDGNTKQVTTDKPERINVYVEDADHDGFYVTAD